MRSQDFSGGTPNFFYIFKVLPNPGPKRLDLFLCSLWLSNRSNIIKLIAPCINDSLAQSEAPFSWLGQGVCTSFKLFFSVLTESFDLEEIHNGRSRLWAFFLPLILHHGKLGNPSG